MIRIIQIDWMFLDKWEVEIQISFEFWVIRKLKNTEIYGKLKRRNKWWSSGQLSCDKVENNISNSYLCGGNNMLNHSVYPV